MPSHSYFAGVSVKTTSAEAPQNLVGRLRARSLQSYPLHMSFPEGEISEVLEISGKYNEERAADFGIALALHDNTTLKELTLRDQLSAEGLQAIAKALTYVNRSLTKLDVSYKERVVYQVIGEGEAVALTKMLMKNNVLKELNLSNHEMMHNAARHIFHALAAVGETQCALQNLNIAGNMLNDESAAMISNVLANNQNLRSLNISANPDITAQGYRALRTALASPQAVLSKLHLDNNLTDIARATEVAMMIRENKSLKSLSCRGASDAVCQILAEANYFRKKISERVGEEVAALELIMDNPIELSGQRKAELDIAITEFLQRSDDRPPGQVKRARVSSAQHSDREGPDLP